jgi:UDP-4-amino-4,6-dideoxy-N-acetyl-beta-L-altrosamine transaminase
VDKTFIPYARQSIDADDIEAVLNALKSELLTTGPEIPKFEKELADTCGARFAVVCANGTAALHLAALALGLKSGESVVTTPITFLATANAARYVGADLIFSDVNAGTINLDPRQLRDLLKRSSKKIKAIFPVHFAGQPAEMEEIYRLSKDRGLFVVEDASHALGASYLSCLADSGEKVRVGSCRHSDLTVFSFHPVKHITSGEGGAITTNDERLYERLKILRNHGMIRNPSEGPWFYEMREVGMNYRLTDIQCALGRNQLKKLGKFLARRKRVAEIYREGFKSYGDFILPLQVLPGFDHAYHLFPVRIDFKRLGMRRAEVMTRLKEAGIGTQVHYIPVHLQPYYRNLYGTKKGDFPNAEAYYEEALSLPMYSAMSDEDVQRVMEALKKVLAG